ncbi:SPRY domain containing-like protein [Reticulomyxa filosa]|uniref:SPRY domain containing-like protein n=1 Tax=Reticulomyxa filosa TaxID=46433 RepID=X6NHX3_RETFI|nr:SPRY domain containing-like protein [Reticulomyxa filosa]|eukprot:ETO25503.1 SPRY domain containing-like protein [Reticulomyxa filosa]
MELEEKEIVIFRVRAIFLFFFLFMSSFFFFLSLKKGKVLTMYGLENKGLLWIFFSPIENKEEIRMEWRSQDIRIRCDLRETKVAKLLGEGIISASHENGIQQMITIVLDNCDFGNLLQNSDLCNVKGYLQLHFPDVTDQVTFDNLARLIQNDKIMVIRGLQICQKKLSLEKFRASLQATRILKELKWPCCSKKGTNKNIDQLKQVVKRVSKFNYSLLDGNKELPTPQRTILSKIRRNSGEKGMCPSQIAKDILSKHFDFPQTYFDAAQDLCYCDQCCTRRKDNDYYFRGNPPMKYVIPRGWVRIGLQVFKGKADANKVFDEWHVAFHGTDVDGVRNIFHCGLQLLKPGDITLGGNKVSIPEGHFKRPFERINLYTNEGELFDPNQIFTSPSIKFNFVCIWCLYLCVQLLTLVHRIDTHRIIVMLNHSIVIILKIRNVFCMCSLDFKPGSYSIGQETVGATYDGILLDEHFNNNELEWYTKENVGIKSIPIPHIKKKIARNICNVLQIIQKLALNSILFATNYFCEKIEIYKKKKCCGNFKFFVFVVIWALQLDNDQFLIKEFEKTKLISFVFNDYNNKRMPN